ncbi:hypothetical protein TWF506_001101 [Arthrobotrys conoides]|uniref:Uncharacterized protein n=1 Tax=Arthrobotrys conoides TaxID=74498 RepID=A0AAN8NM68_9PEZI
MNRITGGTLGNGGTIGVGGGSVGGGTIGSRGGGGSVGGAGGLDTSLRKNFLGGGPVDSERRRESNNNNYNSNNYNSNNSNNLNSNPNPSIFNGRLAPPGMFSQIPDNQSGWPWDYIERLPSPSLENSLGGGGGFSGVSGSGLIKLPQINNNQDQTRLSSPYGGSNPPTVRLSGVQEGIYRNSGQLGSTFSRERKIIPKITTSPVGSSRYVNYSPNKTGNTPGNIGRGGTLMSPHQGPQGDEYEEEEEEEDDSEYGDESYAYRGPGNTGRSPMKQRVSEEVKFTTRNPTPRIVVPPLVDFGRVGAGADRGIGKANINRGTQGVYRTDSDLLPFDLENILSLYTYVDTEDENDNDKNNNNHRNTANQVGGDGTKASCDVTEPDDCNDGVNAREWLPLASQVTRANGNFEVRNPGRIEGASARGGVGTNRAVPTATGYNVASMQYPSMKGPRITVED